MASTPLSAKPDDPLRFTAMAPFFLVIALSGNWIPPIAPLHWIPIPPFASSKVAHEWLDMRNHCPFLI